MFLSSYEVHGSPNTASICFCFGLCQSLPPIVVPGKKFAHLEVIDPGVIASQHVIFRVNFAPCQANKRVLEMFTCKPWEASGCSSFASC